MAITLIQTFLFSVIGMPKEKYDPPDPRRMYTIMSSEEAANGKKSYWAELEISGQCHVSCVFVCVCETDLRINVTAVGVLLLCNLGAVLIGQFSGQGRADTYVCDYLSAISCGFLHSVGSLGNNFLFRLLFCFIF